MDREQAVLGEVGAYVRQAMAQNDPGHDWLHVQRVVCTARSLCLSEPQADPFRTELLALLHDMSDDKLRSNLGAGAVREELHRIGVSPEDTDFVIDGMAYISFRRHPKLEDMVPIEIQIVQDADRIDAMGAMGIARTFSYGGTHGRPFYGREGSSIEHFDEKLLLLYDLLNTDAAKVLAKPRHEFLQMFYKQFYTEV